MRQSNQEQPQSNNGQQPRPLPRVWASDAQLAEIYSVSRATIWRWASAGRLPQPVKLSPGCTRWKLAEIEQAGALA